MPNLHLLIFFSLGWYGQYSSWLVQDVFDLQHRSQRLIKDKFVFPDIIEISFRFELKCEMRKKNKCRHNPHSSLIHLMHSSNKTETIPSISWSYWSYVFKYFFHFLLTCIMKFNLVIFMIIHLPIDAKCVCACANDLGWPSVITISLVSCTVLLIGGGNCR